MKEETDEFFFPVLQIYLNYVRILTLLIKVIVFISNNIYSYIPKTTKMFGIINKALQSGHLDAHLSLLAGSLKYICQMHYTEFEISLSQPLHRNNEI
jgi:hypothetical protein